MRYAIADGRGAQRIQRIGLVELQPGLLRVLDQPAVGNQTAVYTLDELRRRSLERVRRRRADPVEADGAALEGLRAVKHQHVQVDRASQA